MALWIDSRAMEGPKGVVRALRRLYFPVQDAVIRRYARVIQRSSLVREQILAEDPRQTSSVAAVYVHFDKNGEVEDYVVYQLRALAAAGFRITFVSNSPTFGDECRARVRPYCKDVIWRTNIGYDFGAYKDGIASIGNLEELDALILMNDSVYGPLSSLKNMIEEIDQITNDFWGITDSFEYRRHIQTFFMVFFPKAFTSRAFTDFWRDLPYVSHKRWVIRNAEIGLTQILERAGLKGGVLAPYWSLAAKMKARISNMEEVALTDKERSNFERFRSRVMRDRTLNPMQYFWDVLIDSYACPFIKRELIQYNPANIPLISRWREVVATNSDYDIAMIDKHLRDRLRGTSIGASQEL